MERIIGVNPVTEALLNKEKNIEKMKSSFLIKYLKNLKKRE